MRWKLKAAVQNAVAKLPSDASYATYYWLQRRAGRLQRFNPTSRLRAGAEICERIEGCGRPITGKRFFEVGTGRAPLAPISFWLLGAEETITVDLNPYLQAELVRTSLAYMDAHEGEIRQLYGDALRPDRWAELLRLARSGRPTLEDLLDLCRIRYVAPGDAAATDLPDAHVDYHVSYTVFEHIPPDVLEAILREGNRIVRPGGLFVHCIDYSDHFSHSDPTISAINFLQYDDRVWARYAGNRYMYMNRLRHDDFLDLFARVGHQVIQEEPATDERCREILSGGSFPLDDRFRAKAVETLAIRGCWMTTAPH
jgi:SAM-dependent methyltransferase